MTELFEPLSTFDMAVIYAGMAAPWIGVIAAIVLLAAVAVFAFTSREPGRIELFLGVYLFAAEFYFFTTRYHALALEVGGGLVRESWVRLLGVLPLIFVAVGLARLALSHFRRRRDPRPSGQ
jgi:hypothetical protein